MDNKEKFFDKFSVRCTKDSPMFKFSAELTAKHLQEGKSVKFTVAGELVELVLDDNNQIVTKRG